MTCCVFALLLWFLPMSGLNFFPKALVRLHQLRLLSNRLIAVYARPEHLAEEEKVL